MDFDNEDEYEDIPEDEELPEGILNYEWHDKRDPDIKNIGSNLCEGPLGFYFWDESQTRFAGPFPSMGEARTKLREYESWLDSCQEELYED